MPSTSRRHVTLLHGSQENLEPFVAHESNSLPTPVLDPTLPCDIINGVIMPVQEVDYTSSVCSCTRGPSWSSFNALLLKLLLKLKAVMTEEL
ncbi:hypothetical protein FQA47_005744 [Oryzias melastigma]|uniref:Uncharacterized protein n=1 Tax=Oryzias melastigma TaxID=30732 RepID=A0A834FSZ0_ORYME|nr:hypothetical protein FQA47_005744 [Oryzias melastigma]